MKWDKEKRYEYRRLYYRVIVKKQYDICEYNRFIELSGDNYYNVVVKATDASGNKSVHPLGVQVTDVDEIFPTFTPYNNGKIVGNDIVFDFNENKNEEEE